MQEKKKMETFEFLCLLKRNNSTCIKYLLHIFTKRRFLAFCCVENIGLFSLVSAELKGQFQLLVQLLFIS